MTVRGDHCMDVKSRAGRAATGPQPAGRHPPAHEGARHGAGDDSAAPCDDRRAWRGRPEWKMRAAVADAACVAPPRRAAPRGRVRGWGGGGAPASRGAVQLCCHRLPCGRRPPCRLWHAPRPARRALLPRRVLGRLTPSRRPPCTAAAATAWFLLRPTRALLRPS